MQYSMKMYYWQKRKTPPPNGYYYAISTAECAEFLDEIKTAREIYPSDYEICTVD